MTRVKRGLVSKRRHNKLFEQAKGYRGTKSKLTKVAREAVLHAGQYAFNGRKRKKIDMRRLWIARIGEAAKIEGTSYSRLIDGLKKAKIELNRKILSDMIVNDPSTFKSIVEKVKA
ncbi:MAG: 50S ribosomal protein L20 [Candidatus Levyibacteriota bacterium]